MAKQAPQSTSLKPELLGPGRLPEAQEKGSQGPNPRRTLTLIIVADLALLVLTAVVLRGFVVFGPLLIWLVYVSIDHPVYVVVSSGSVSMVQRSLWNGKPKRQLASWPATILEPQFVRQEGGLTHLSVPGVWVKHAAFDRLRAAVPDRAALNSQSGQAMVERSFSSPVGPRRGTKAGGIALLAIGAFMMVGAVVLLVNPPKDLSALVLNRPAPGMVATSVGAGGAQPTHVYRQAFTVVGIGRTGAVPTEPILFLEPARTTGIGASSEPALWKVWWDGAAQQEVDVSLQQHLNAVDAEQGVLELDSKNQDPSSFDNNSVRYTLVSGFTVPGIPNAVGNVWAATGQMPFEFRFVVFSRGDVAALVSTATFRGKSNPAEFDHLALAQYASMNGAASSTNAVRSPVGLLVLGLALAAVGCFLLLRNRKGRGEPAYVATSTATLVTAPAVAAPQYAAPAPSPAPAPAPAPPSAYCSWCGKERNPDAYAIHHCGSRDRPPAFCSGCGTPLQSSAGTNFCRSCGTSVNQLSPPGAY